MSMTLDRLTSLRCLSAILSLTLALAIVSGCSSKPPLSPEQQAQADLTAYEAELRKVVIADPVRADKLMALTNEFQKLLQDTVTHVSSYRAKAVALNANYDATRADYDSLFNQQDAAREAFMQKATALREQMAALITDAEWAQLKKARLRGLDADLQELLSASHPVI
jgi:hypothetical protein